MNVAKQSILFSVASLCILFPVNASGTSAVAGYMERGARYYRQYNLAAAVKEFEDGLTAARAANDRRFEESLAAGLGSSYTAIGNYRKAAFYFGEALSVAELERDRTRVTSDLVDLGLINDLMGNHYKALTYYEDALRITGRRSSSAGAARILLHEADAYSSLLSWQKAVSSCHEALRITTLTRDRSGTGTVFIAIGDLYRNYRKQNRAIAYYESALKTAREIGDKKLLMRSLSRLGKAEYEQGNHARSMACLREALSLSKQFSDPKETIDSFNELGLIYYQLKDYRNALACCVQARDAARDLGSDLLLASSLENLGRIYRSLHDYALAVPCLEQARSLREAIGLTTDALRTLIADCYRKEGEPSKAETAYFSMGDDVQLGQLQFAHKDYKRAISYFYKSFVVSAAERNARDMFASYTGIGYSYEALGDFKSAADNFGKALNLFEEQELLSDEGVPIHSTADEIGGFAITEPYEGMVRCTYRLGKPEEALFYSERLKMNNFSATLRAPFGIKEARGIPLSMAQEEDDNLSKIALLTHAAAEAHVNGRADDRQSAEEALGVVRAKQGHFIERLRKFYPAYACFHYPSADREYSLKNNETALEFEVTDTSLFLFKVNGGSRRVSVSVIPMTRAEVLTRVTRIRSLLLEASSSAEDDHALISESRSLFADLLSRALNDLPSGTSLVIVPDESLGLLPFGALVFEEGATGKKDVDEHARVRLLKNLEDKWHLSFAQSLSWLDIVRSAESFEVKQGKIMTIYDPSFVRARADDGSDHSSEIGEAINTWNTTGSNYGALYKGGTGKALEPIRGIKAVLDNFSALFSSSAASVSALQPGTDSITSLNYNEYQYILFALPCIVNAKAPYVQEPFFILPESLASEHYGKILPASRVCGMQIDAEVAASPWSDTGPLSDSDGFGPLTMARALQTAGCQSVLISLWRTSDDAVAAFSSSFFTCLSEGSEPQEALEMAKKSLRDHGFNQPYYWAGFILAGK